jgi:hypothetical protein
MAISYYTSMRSIDHANAAQAETQFGRGCAEYGHKFIRLQGASTIGRPWSSVLPRSCATDRGLLRVRPPEIQATHWRNRWGLVRQVYEQESHPKWTKNRGS